MSFRRVLLKLHLYAALVAGVFIAVLGLTGAVMVFESRIDRALHPRLAYVTPTGSRLPLETLLARARQDYPEGRIGTLRFGEAPDQSYQFLHSQGFTIFVDPYTGDVLGRLDRVQWERTLPRIVHRLHTQLLAGEAGAWVVGVATIVTGFLLVSGLILWWPRRILTVRRAGSWKRSNFDLHNALGLYTSPVLLVVVASGLIIGFEGLANPLINRLNPSSASASASAPRPTGSTRPPGAGPISIDAAERLAVEALPGAAITLLSIPNGERRVITAKMKYPEDRTPAGRSQVTIDRYLGQVAAVESTRRAPPGTRIQNLKRSLHTGDVFGAPTQALYFLSALGLVGQVLSGLLIWWNSRSRSAKGSHEAEAARAPGEP